MLDHYPCPLAADEASSAILKTINIFGYFVNVLTFLSKKKHIRMIPKRFFCCDKTAIGVRLAGNRPLCVAGGTKF